MSRFDELTELAIECRDGFRKMKAEVHAFSHQMAQLLQGYLGLPTEALFFHTVRRDGSISSERQVFPSPCFHGDGFFYFRLGIDFPVPASAGWAYRVEGDYGIRQTSDGFRLVMPNGKEADINATNIEKRFCEPLYDELKAFLARPWTKPRKGQIGFHVTHEAVAE